MNYKLYVGIALLMAILLSSCSEESTTKSVIIGDVSNGKTLFETNCAACHQKDGKGKTGFAPSLNNIDFLAIANDHLIKRFILEGRAGTTMASFKNNPNVAENVDDIVAYMRSWSKEFALYEQIPLDYEWKSNGDADNGKALFANYCAACHGAEGQGYFAGVPGTGIGNASFVSAVPDDYMKQTLLIGRVGTAMKSFDGAKGVANLTNNEMDDVVAFLRTKGAYNKLVATATTAEYSEPATGSYTFSGGLITIPYLLFIICITAFALITIIYALSVINKLQKDIV